MRSKLPGSYWFDGLVGAEKAAQYEAEAYEFQTDPMCAL